MRKVAMKATRSLDGVLRFTIRVEHRVGRSELIDAVALNLENNTDLQRQPTSRAMVFKIARDTLGMEGSSGAQAQADDVIRECRSKATEIVERLFPELIKKDKA